MLSQNSVARTLKALHVPGKPIILTNVYDAPSANSIASLPKVKALATASYAVAAAAGVQDDDMTLETNLVAVRAISPIAKKHQVPFTVDWQDGYGERLEEGMTAIIEAGVVGINLEDCNKATQTMYTETEAVQRIKRVLDVAKQHRIPDFVLNARTDALIHKGPLSEAISRGKAYLEAGATTVFVWGGSIRGGITKEEVEKLVHAFGGRLNVSLKLSNDGLTIKELQMLGVARISIGPALQFKAMETFATEANQILDQA